MTSQSLPPSGDPWHNRYRIHQKVRNDSLGEVFRATQNATGNEVAFLQLYRHLNRVQPKAIARLRSAAAQATATNHPSIVQVIDYQLDYKVGDLAIVMKFVTGDTVRTWLASQSGGVSAPMAAKVVADLADAFQYLAENEWELVQPVVDPDKIIITQKRVGRSDHPVMVDLGFHNTLEQWGGSAANGRALRASEDVHALGLLFYDILNGYFPAEYSATHSRFSDQSQVENSISDLETRLLTAPDSLWATMRRALAVDLAQRFADLGEFSRALRALVEVALTDGEPLIALPRAVSHTGDRIVLRELRDDRTTEVREYPLRKDVTTIGASNSDITLKGIGSQRLILLRHDRVYGRYYTISDAPNDVGAAETQLIFVDDVPLALDYATILPEGAEVRVAHYRLSLQADSGQQAAQVQRAAANGVGLLLANTDFAAAPNEVLAIPITVRNTTNEVGRLGIVLHGAPDTWVINQIESRRLNADETEQLTVYIKLPTVSVVAARSYPLIVRAISRVLDAQVAAVLITVTVRPVDDVTATLEPESLRAGRQGGVHIFNRGNSARVIQVQWQDRANELVFEPVDAVVSAPPGESVQVGFRAYVRQPRWFGMEKRHSLNVLVAPQDGGLARTLIGEVLSRALIPGWLPPMVLLAVLLMLLISTVLLQPEFAAHAVEVSGTPILGQPIAEDGMELTWTPINSCFYSIYKDGMAYKWLIWHWQAQQVRVEILDEAPGIYEVRLRGCLLMGEKSWQVNIAPAPTPSPMPTLPPQVKRFVVSPTEVLLGDQGDICFAWEVDGRAPDLRIMPNIGAVSPEVGEKCIPIADIVRSEGEALYKLVATYDETEVFSSGVTVTARRAVCTQNTTIPLYIREGPGTQFPDRGQLGPGAAVYPLARPFVPQEQEIPEPWLQVVVSLDDPRPAWVAYNYLNCPDLTGFPTPGLIPPTPTPSPTWTPMPTPTATPVLTPKVSISPEIIREGDCTMLRWDIQGVDKVFLNNVGIVGVGEQQICDPPKGTHIFTWKIIQRDGNIVELTRTLYVNAGLP